MREVKEVQRVRKIFRALAAVLTLCILSLAQLAVATDSPLVNIRELSREELEIPVYGSDLSQPASVVSQTLLTVGDDKNLFGVVAPATGGSYGTIANLASPKVEYHQISSEGIEKVSTLSATRCGEHAPAPASIAKMIARTPQKKWREFRLYVVASAEFSRNRTEADITAQVVATVAAANLFMESLEIKLSVSGIQIIRPLQDPFRVATENQDAYQSLEILRNDWRQRPEIIRDGVVYLATGKFGGIFGLAYTGSSCVSPENSVIFASQGGLGPEAELSLAATLAHELGHVLGMSHDHTIYSEGPSLMYPMFTMSATGFSPFSVSQFLNHAGVGQPGGICLNEISAPDELQLEGGRSEIVRIREGRTFRRRLRLPGSAAAFAGLANQPQLISGMKLNLAAGEFTYRPDFNTASQSNPSAERKVEFALVLEDGRIVRKQFVFIVSNINRAPRFSRAPKRSVAVRRGATVNLSWRVTDPDQDDLTFTPATLRALRALPGRKDIHISGGELRLRYRPGFSGSRPIRVVVRDSGGRTVSRQLVLTAR